MLLRDSRRLTGPNLLSSSPGAILDVALAGEPAAPLIAAWQEHAQRILQAVGWPDSERRTRTFAGGASLFLAARVDALYAATEVNEWAFEAALATLDERPAPRLEAAAARLRLTIAEESNPPLLALERGAAEHGVAFFCDDELASVGLGDGSLTWPVREIPGPRTIDWNAVHDVPVILVTGTNGKTTTVRMLAAIAQAAGRIAGYTSTDGIVVGGETMETGDWSGPGGARRLLRQRAVELAILECARGGMLRRGLPVRHADIAVITNVAADHLGEWGIADLEALADAKWIVARAADQLVVNADDPLLRRRAATSDRRIVDFSAIRGDQENRGQGTDIRSAENGGQDKDVRSEAVTRSGRPREENLYPVPGFSEGVDVERWLARGGIVAHRDTSGRQTELMLIDEIPATLDGAARHNVANALAAAAAAHAVSLPTEAMVAGLGGFRENPGRLQRFDLAGVQVLVDFAHNPHGLAALIETVRAFRPARWLVTLAQAGDRSDEDLRGLAQTAAAAYPDRILVKELHKYLRGRAKGEIPRILVQALRDAGFPPERIGHADSEMDSVRQALAWARPGDLLLLLTHAERSAVLSYLDRLQERGGARSPATEIPKSPRSRP